MIGRLYVLGHPVAHSKSPAMHNAAYRALGLDWEYGFADCPMADEARAFLSGDDWLALNITMPYKRLAFEVATECSDVASIVGGANVLVRRGDDLVADNTDGKGCVEYLARCGVGFAGAHAVVCGTGPTAISIMHAVARAGAERIFLLSRDDAKAQLVLSNYEARCDACGVATTGVRFTGGAYDEHAVAIAAADIIIDATSLGMKADDPAPFDTCFLSKRQTVFDVVYANGDTTLVKAARETGCAAFNGAGMLVAQAVESVRDFIEWSSVPADPGALDLFAIMSEAAGFSIL